MVIASMTLQLFGTAKKLRGKHLDILPRKLGESEITNLVLEVVKPGETNRFLQTEGFGTQTWGDSGSQNSFTALAVNLGSYS